MGITLSGAIQVYCDPRPDLSIRAFWDTVCIWEFNKDYDLMRFLGEEYKPEFVEDWRRDWPEDAKYSYCLQVFTVDQLPLYTGLRYQTMVNAASYLGKTLKVRILFWRD